MNQQQVKSYSIFFFKILLSAACITYLLRTNDNLETLSGVISQVSLGKWFLAFSCFVLARLLAAFRMKQLVDFFEIKMSFRLVVRDVFVANFFNAILPSGSGDIYRAKKIKDNTGSFLQGGLIVTLDRLFGATSLILFAFVGIFISNNQFKIFEKANSTVWILTGLFFLAAGLLFYFGLTRFKIAKVITAAFRKLSSSPKTLAKCLSISLVGMIVTFIGIFILGQELQIGWPFLTYLTFIPLVELLASLPVSISGLGLREVSYVTAFGLLGTSAAQAVALGLLQFSLILALALIGLFIFAFDKKQ